MVITFVLSCGDVDVVEVKKDANNPYVGNMNDFSYSKQRTDRELLYRVNANGQMVSIVDWEGKFIWADYAAPWCGACETQASVIKSLEHAFSDDVVFMTVMTSASPGYESIPTHETARAWAQRFGLDPKRVVAATNLWSMTIPTHVLYSPEGQTLYCITGYLPANQIRSIISLYTQDWKRWSENGVIADWMRFGETVGG
jgi:thiol-disulfide isomerase/thioredoxin